MKRKVDLSIVDLNNLLNYKEIDKANKKCLNLLKTSNPVLIDVKPAVEAIPNMSPNTVLTSGPSMSWDSYTGGQRAGIIGGILHEGLADTPEEAEKMIQSNQVQIAGCQDYNCIGSLAGITTASMPVLIVEDGISGNKAYCTLFEGKATDRLNYGVYNEKVEENLLYLREVIGPLLSKVIRKAGGIELNPIMRRAVHMGDELHSRNTAATLLLTRELFPHILQLDRNGTKDIDELIDYLMSGDYFFLRVSMAAAKVGVDRIKEIPNSTIVSSMAFSGKEFGIKVAGLGDRWFTGPLPELKAFFLFDGYSAEDIEFMGGESVVMETFGLGGFAQAAAFALQTYQGGTVEKMIEANLKMYKITAGEHENFRIPYLGYRGTPLGIDIRKVVKTGITPIMDVGIAGRGGGQIGAGSAVAPLEPFKEALEIYINQYYKS